MVPSPMTLSDRNTIVISHHHK